ncbi:excinuclease ABC subunit UvrC [Simiduia agarivorans]|uniref:UvrABC system protein C n=1 Tax=Simiduia agarivorans (strain DSM 21679 / JCM 13881 / BCRC 17597 / SA1) TaxID=1117647 RepID=K4KU72_SIMAS|nr:excinuclease ABC subunit UvrC [Simiduia agarivorans]AFU97522.1 excinuclease ABC subunit C [Simiduia agarivorans SA1 = DSM 21679]
MTAPVEFDSKAFVKSLPGHPGVYQMFDADGKILYVGKAKNLKNRVASYFRATGLTPKTEALVARIRSMQVTLTETEVEALLLEQSLIKAQRPPYNILLRDDKSYPYIFLSDRDDFPRIVAHRGSKRKRGSYFGPFPGAAAVHESIQFLQKTFRLRSCEDSVFANRSRPCLQYQIGRCSGSCVDLISKEDYAEDLKHAVDFLKGHSSALIVELADQMEQASNNLAFERAAMLRDQIANLKKVQSESAVDNQAGDVDVIGCALRDGRLCVHFLFVRAGRVQGSRSFFVNAGLDESEAELLLAFLAQWYLAGGERDWPKEILVPQLLTETDLFAQAVSRQAEKKVAVVNQVRSHRAQWQQLAAQAAEQNLASEAANKANMLDRFESLQQLLNLEAVPERLECFDISHTGGERTIASCVVFNREGALKSDYRRFNIDGITGGDDYAAMSQALNRRYSRVLEEGAQLPDLLIVDGGKGQLSMAREVLAELGLSDLPLLGIAKGTTRKAGFETLLYAGREFALDSRHAALHLLQAIRDEAHRFAITGHKQRRDKARRTSRLEDIEGVGPKRRRELLRHFGGLQGVQAASAADLAKVPGISKKLADDIYSALNSR